MNIPNKVLFPIIKIRNDNKTYTLFDFGQGFDLQNESEESMTLIEKSLFDILDEFFQRHRFCLGNLNR